MVFKDQLLCVIQSSNQNCQQACMKNKNGQSVGGERELDTKIIELY